MSLIRTHILVSWIWPFGVGIEEEKSILSRILFVNIIWMHCTRNIRSFLMLLSSSPLQLWNYTLNLEFVILCRCVSIILMFIDLFCQQADIFFLTKICQTRQIYRSHEQRNTLVLFWLPVGWQVAASSGRGVAPHYSLLHKAGKTPFILFPVLLLVSHYKGFKPQKQQFWN